MKGALQFHVRGISYIASGAQVPNPLVAVDASHLPDCMIWEPSKGNRRWIAKSLFPFDGPLAAAMGHLNDAGMGTHSQGPAERLNGLLRKA